LTPEAKNYASTLISQVKDGIHQYYIDSGGIFYKIASVNTYHYTSILFFFCLLLMIVISYMTKAPSAEQLQYTFGASTPEHKRLTRESWNKWDVIHTIIIIGIIVLFYVYFW
jgi:SSS family solute:Na+ symporter